MTDRHATVEQFLIATAAKQPTPGGGAVAGLAGALAASMGEMVLNYSLGRRNQESLQPQLSGVRDTFTRARLLLLELMEQDQTAYQAMADARKLPADDPTRDSQARVALVAGVRVPQSIAATGIGMLQAAEHAAADANPYLLSDLLVCCDLSAASVRAAVRSVRVNVPSLENRQEQQLLIDWANQVVAHAAALEQKTTAAIEARMASSGK